MEQEKIKINNIVIWQPDNELVYNFETTYASGATRTQAGVGYFEPLFTVEQLGYTASNIPQIEATKILQQIDKGKRFKLHYFSIHYGKWREDDFYVGQGNLTIQSLKKGLEKLKTLSFNMTGINPI